MCVGNSARSQIAEGLAKAMLSIEHNIESAGSMPSGIVHAGAIECMESIGIDISDHSSKSIVFSINSISKSSIDFEE